MFDDAFIFSWGHYDRKQLVQDCRRHEINGDLPKGFADFKNLFKKQKLLPRQGLELTLSGCMRFEGRPHSALSDAKNTKCLPLH
ncbi:MAG: hypothetical protein U1F40_06205 [Turneriella sp.]